MKNYITIAALVAVGATYANAEADLLTLDMVDSWTELTLTTPANGSLTASNSGFVWSEAIGNTLTESWQLSFDWAVSQAGAARTGTFELFGSNGKSGGAQGVVLQHKGGNVFELNNRGSEVYTSVSGVNFSEERALHVTITYLESSVDSFASTFILQIGDKAASGVAPTSNTDFSGADNSSRLWTNGAKDLFSNITLKMADAVIPEPSAFGLLAGLGALALVGARRRRK